VVLVGGDPTQMRLAETGERDRLVDRAVRLRGRVDHEGGAVRLQAALVEAERAFARA
jgi:hypothetical protein